MAEIQWLDEKTGLIPGPSSTLVMLSGEKSCILVDTGLNRDSGRKILKLLEKNDLFPVAIINTHSHADHCGGNSLLKEKTSCKIFAPAGEADIVENPWWEPFYLFGGSPVEELKVPFLMAQPSRVDFRVSPGRLKIADTEVDVISLSGHTPHQIGIDTGTFVFASDSVFSEDIWEKHRFVYFADIGMALNAIETLMGLDKPLILSHKGIYEKPEDILAFNRSKIEEMLSWVLDIVSENPLSTDEVLINLCKKLSVELNSEPSYFLARQILTGCLSYLKTSGKVKSRILKNRFVWHV